MSIDFDGVNSKLEHTTATALNYSTLTVCVWARAAGLGEGSFGRIIQADESTTSGTSGGNGWNFGHSDTADTLRFAHAFNTTAGSWTFPASDNVWNPVSLTYDRTATANNAAARVNFTSVTVTRSVGPVGTATAANSGYCIGNRTGQDRTWHGLLQHLMLFNVILSAGEQDAALRKPGSIQRGLQAWWPLWTAADLMQYIAAGPAAGTGTALADGATSPRTAMPFSGTHGWLGWTAPVVIPPGGRQGLRLSAQRNRRVRAA